MEFETATKLLRVIPARRRDARTVRQIATRFFAGVPTRSEIRSVERWVAELLAGYDPPLLDATDAHPNRYFLRLDRVANWFLTEELGLQVLLSREALKHALGPIAGVDSDEWKQAAEQVASASPEIRRLRRKIRYVPDGIGRLPATIAPAVLSAVADAVTRDVTVRIDYVSSRGQPSSQEVNVLGLVAKDGTTYLIANSGPLEAPRHFALQRVDRAQATDTLSQPPADFDLDRYIASTHMLSHALERDAPAVHLRLLVADEALYHFRERPLATNQTIKPSAQPDWSEVTAEIPITILLLPFLLSMGPWVNVIAPDSLRDEMARRVVGMAAHYQWSAYPTDEQQREMGEGSTSPRYWRNRPSDVR